MKNVENKNNRTKILMPSGELGWLLDQFVALGQVEPLDKRSLHRSRP
jgi:hypothetical protein